MMDAARLPARLRELREARGFTQKALAELAGVSFRGVAQWEQGVREPGWSNVVALCKALGVSPEAFLQEPGPPGDRPAGRPRKDQAAAAGAAAQAPRPAGKDVPPADRKPAQHKPRGRKIPRPRGS